jgi:hypothetical protein
MLFAGVFSSMLFVTLLYKPRLASEEILLTKDDDHFSMLEDKTEGNKKYAVEKKDGDIQGDKTFNQMDKDSPQVAWLLSFPNSVRD